MKRHLPLLLVLIALPTTATAPAADFQLEEGFVRLDNGKDLAGWVNRGGDWSVVDGAIHLEYSSPPPGGALFSTHKHGRDCVVRLQYRASHGGDSGVFLHGAQFQVRDYENSYPDTKRLAEFDRPAGEWNDLEFDVTDGVAVVRLNGHVAAEAWKLGDKPELGVGVQKEQGNFDFRYIRVKEKAAAEAATERPNVLFVAIDDLCCQAVGCYGGAAQTPNLDRLAAEGVRFDRAYVQVTFCNPSRTSFLTGLRPDRTGVLDNSTHFRTLLPDVVTLPQLFRESGYFTMRLGKIYHGTESMEDPKAWNVALYPKATPLGHKGERRNMTDGEVRWCWWMAAEGGDEDQSDGQIARHAVEFLRREHERPFFLAVGFHKPHDPFVAPARYFDLYPPEKLAVHQDPTDRSPTPEHHIGGPWKKSFDQFDDRDRREFLRSYYASTTFMDAQLGKVLSALDEEGLADDTVVMLMSDHGYHLGERQWWNKTTLYEYSSRTPLVVRVPGRKGMGRPSDRLVEFVDVYPTLVELCGLEPPPHLEGQSFAALLDSPTAEGKKAAFTQLQRSEFMGRAVRTERWRYVEFDEGRQGAELFDHQNDPGEFFNLAGDPQYAGVVAELKALLLQRDDRRIEQ